MIKDVRDYKDRKIGLTWHEEIDFSKLGNIVQVYGVLFNDNGEILIVSSTNGNEWGLPGGTPEDGESFEETLIREVDEEADVEIKDIMPLGYQNAVYLDKPGSDHQQLRYAARIKKINKQTIDPAHNKILLRKFVKPKEFLDYCPWGKIGKRIIENAVEVLGKRK